MKTDTENSYLLLSVFWLQLALIFVAMDKFNSSYNISANN